jgi:hypothetical protein
MKPPADLPREIVLLSEAFGRRLGMTADDFWSVVYRRAPKPPGWDEAWAEAFLPLSLTSYPNAAKVRYVSQALVQEGPRGRKVGRPLDADHPFTAWLAAKNITVTEWAAEHTDPDTGKPYNRARVKSWFAKGAGARPAPRHAVDVIEAESTDPETKRSAVPATRRTWRNGIRE